MCVILIGKIGKNYYERAKEVNPHGLSCLSKKYGLIKNPSKEIVNDVVDDFAIWHFRISTGGNIDESNVHPFEVCYGNYLLYHNGIVTNRTVDNNKSDTHELADLLYKSSIGTAKSVLASLVNTSFYSNKFVLVEKANPFNYVVYGNWSFNDGILMSNEGSIPSHRFTTKMANAVRGRRPVKKSNNIDINTIDITNYDPYADKPNYESNASKIKQKLKPNERLSWSKERGFYAEKK